MYARAVYATENVYATLRSLIGERVGTEPSARGKLASELARRQLGPNARA